MIDGLTVDRLPQILMYYVNNRGTFNFNVSKETDRLCMFLATIEALFNKDIDHLSMHEFDEKAEQLYTLKNMREFVLKIKNNANGIPDIPYLHDLISISDFPVFKKVKNMNTKK